MAETNKAEPITMYLVLEIILNEVVNDISGKCSLDSESYVERRRDNFFDQLAECSMTSCFAYTYWYTIEAPIKGKA
jgi:hypothetical protein